MKKLLLVVLLLLVAISFSGCSSVDNNYSSTIDNNTENVIENDYEGVQIGNQYWMRKNLNVGTMIFSNSSQANNDIIEKYCYKNDETFCDTDGGLYQWDEMMQYVANEGSQGICPDGWHIPTHEEWKILKNKIKNDSSYQEVYKGDMLKKAGLNPNICREESIQSCGDTGFDAILTSFFVNDSFTSRNSITFWTSTVPYNSSSFVYHLISDGLGADASKKTNGFSIRCLKD